MRCLLFIVGLSLVSSLYAAQSVNNDNVFKEQTKSLRAEREAREISDIRTNIKNSAKSAWDAIKNIAEKTKNKIKQWIKNVKDRAHSLQEHMEERIENIRIKSKITLEKIIGTGQLVKKCFQRENEAVEKLLKQIVKEVSSCTSDALHNVPHLERGLQLELNETNFINEVENKMNKCVTEKDVEQCLNKVRQEMYSSMEDVESKVLTSRTESRGIADDLLEAVIFCSIVGLVDSSNVIASESIKIIHCVEEGY